MYIFFAPKLTDSVVRKMASDLKLEIFSYQLFETFWYTKGYLSETLGISSKYAHEYQLDPQLADIYEYFHYKAVIVKRFFYHYIFDKEISQNFSQFECSPFCISDYLSRTCGRDGLFRDLSVFERLLTSCAFMVNLCFFCDEFFGYTEIIIKAHLCWTIYFDEFKEEFYNQGGWSQLNIVSFSYAQLFELLNMGRKTEYEATANRQTFIVDCMKSVSNYENLVNCFRTKGKTITKSWVNFNLQNSNKSDDASNASEDSSKYQMLRDPKVMEQFLLQFRRLCDPTSSEMLKYLSYKRGYTCKESNRTISRSYLKLNSLNLKDTTADISSDPAIIQREIEHDLKENVDQTEEIIAIDLSLNKKNVYQTDGKIPIDLSKNNETTSSTIEKYAPQNASFFKHHFSSGEFSANKTHSATDSKLDQEAKREIDLERKSPCVKHLLRMILVLGNTGGIANVRLSLPGSNKHQRRKKSKKK
ncbi:uncharacterized protein NPIL_317551 [Nephila pilipes]|uniref:Uncharacterized protein n=1 Tax=Nephila pilipes TaxID=299642 RepID=A0A8X6IWE8_NEPPI|nr:uncharacterized protein NPIL_317551 [Nephila pilipes]